MRPHFSSYPCPSSIYILHFTFYMLLLDLPCSLDVKDVNAAFAFSLSYFPVLYMYTHPKQAYQALCTYIGTFMEYMASMYQAYPSHQWTVKARTLSIEPVSTCVRSAISAQNRVVSFLPSTVRINSLAYTRLLAGYYLLPRYLPT